ncbi:hypothetical protein HPB51_020667 [Rhipicephalus microplus]|uniref:Tick transposon n=1 Tax=Rhipicephalus microplus TaxID=6941 RepID=A0A9J6D707_RHIMP|nr:hypothetical protein HPB51_020667 [Rhipicephalus microplus]
MFTDPQFPTRLGNFLSRDTARDLPIIRNAGRVQWVNLQENLRSDHFILEFTQKTQAAPSKECRATYWDEFGKHRKADETEYVTLEELFSRLVEDELLTTKTAQIGLQVDAMNSRLAH